MEGASVELRQYLDILKRRKWMIVQATVVVAVAAYLFASMKTPVYESSARVLLRPNDAAEQLYPGYSVEVFSDPDRYVSGQLDIIQSEAVARIAAEELPGAADPEALLAEVSAGQGGLTDVVDITGHSVDPVRARDVANAFARGYIENRRQYAVAGLQKAVEELDRKLVELEATIAEYDRRIGDGGIALGAGTTPTRPEGSGIEAPTQPGIEGPEGTGLDVGGQPTNDEALKAARYAAATQYQSLFFRQQELSVDISLKRGNAELIAEAKTPTVPVSPKPTRDGVLGGFVGLLLGVGFAFLREQLDDRIRSRDDAERATGLPALADLPLAPEPTSAALPAALSSPHSPLAEAVRSLRTSLLFVGVDSPVRRILVTSPGPGDGKSTVAANLAAVYAQAGQTTVLVSGDLRRPTIDRIFGLEKGTHGLSELLAGIPHPTPQANGDHGGNGRRSPLATSRLGGVLAQPDGENLYVLPSGATPPNPAELLGSARMAQLLDDLGELADVIIVDTPPLLAVTDAAALASQVDAVLLVTALGETHRGAAKRAHELVANADVRFFGLVLNKVDTSSDGYYRYYDYYGASESSRTPWWRRSRPAAATSGEHEREPAVTR